MLEISSFKLYYQLRSLISLIPAIFYLWLFKKINDKNTYEIRKL